MMIISFAWTTPALLAGRKSVTRRDWRTREYASRFHKGDLVAAYDRQPRYGGKQVAAIRLTADPCLESTADAPPEDYEAEGFAYLQGIGAKVDRLDPRTLWRVWHWPSTAQKMWVVRFEMVKILGRDGGPPRGVGRPLLELAGRMSARLSCPGR